VNFHQAPVTRYLKLLDRTSPATVGELTVGPQVFGTTAPVINSSTWVSGRAVNLFFETPVWPSSTFSINLDYNSGGAATTLLAAPNVMIVDTAANVTNHFIRGNVAFTNTTNNPVNITYCGILTNVVPVGARTSAANFAWVQPSDTLDVTGNGQIADNISGVQNITVLATRVKNNSDSYYVEFNAPLDLDGTGRVVIASSDASGFTSSPTTGNAVEAAFEYTLKYGAADFRKLAVDGLTLTVIGKDSGGTPVFTGNLVSCVNLTYSSNNKSGVVAKLFDPTRFTQVSRAWANANFRPLPTVSTSAFNSQRITIDRDFVAGAEPYRCLALVYPSTTNPPQVAITINPIS
jgi:hypothetical protein